MITKNFRLNALANHLYNNITAINGGNTSWLTGRPAIRGTGGGVNGTRQLIDGYALEALKETYPQWESVGITMLEKCVNAGLTDTGREIWQSMINDMGATVAGGNHA
jgi:hypothetical protein